MSNCSSASMPSYTYVDTSSDAGELVTQGWNLTQGYASSAFTLASQFIGDLSAIGAQLTDLPTVSVEVGTPSLGVTPFVMPSAPGAPDLDPQFPLAPAEPVLDAVTGLVVPDAPIFDVAAPAVNTDIETPDPFTGDVPTAPALDTVTLPTEPVVDFPLEPTLYDLLLPDAPTIQLLDFYSDHEPGDVPSPPSIDFTFTEPPFNDTLMDALKARLGEWVAGTATGIPAEVEQAIWERARARENQNMLTALDTIITEWTAKGFSMPQGLLTAQAQQIAQETANKNSALSRDIAIEQAQLEQKNIHFAVEQTVKLESDLLTYANAVAQRALEAAKVAATIAVDVFNAQVAAFNASIQAYLADAQVYRTQIEAETRKIELYKAQIDAQRAIGEVNQQLVALYRERINAQMAKVDIYKVQMQAAQIQADVNRVKIEAFRALIDAYVAQVQAKTAEYEQYATQIKAEGLKVDVYKSQADAYGAVVNGYGKHVDALVAVKNSEIRIEQELPLEQYRTVMQAFASQVDGEAKRISALASLYDSEVKAFAAEVDGESSRVDAEVKVYQTEVNRLIADANTQIDAARANLQTMLTATQLLMEALRSGSTVAAQLAASALSAVNLSGTISESAARSTSASFQSTAMAQNQSACNTNYNYSGEI